MAHLLHLSTTGGLVRTRKDCRCRSARDTPNEKQSSRRGKPQRTDFLAAEKGDPDTWRAFGEFPDDCKADAPGIGEAVSGVWKRVGETITASTFTVTSFVGR